MTIKLTSSKGAAKELLVALDGTDEAAQEAAVDAFINGIAADVAREYRLADNDSAEMQRRGFRTLTSAESEYYEKIIDALSSKDPRQAFASISDDIMPKTIIDDVMRDLKEKRPLLDKINVEYTSFITEWVLNDHTTTRAVWGEIGDEITKEITSAFRVVDVKQGKLSAFACVSIDMLKLGPVWLDGYVRTCLFEAWGAGLEYGAVNGNGVKGEPVGMIRDIHDGVSIDTNNGYPSKTAIEVTSFDVATFGGLVNRLVKNEKGRVKSVDVVNGGSLSIICNTTTYLTKVLPATCYLAPDGYRKALPVPCDIVMCNEMGDGEAILALCDEYSMFVGGDRGIETSDEFKFTEDKRYFKIVSYASGKAIDDTSAILLDVSGLKPLVMPVMVDGVVSTLEVVNP